MRIMDWSSDVCSSDFLCARRLVGQKNCRNTTNAFAGGRLQFNGRDKEALTLFYTLPLQRLPDDKESILDNEVKWDRESFDLVFWGGFLNKPNIIGKSSLDLYFLALDEDDSDTRLTRNRSEEHTSELQSLMRISYAVFCLKKKKSQK